MSASKKKESLREYRQRVSNQDGREKFAYRVEARNFSMRFLSEVMKANDLSVDEMAVAAGLPSVVLSDILDRDPLKIPQRDTLFAVREASQETLSPNTMHLLKNALEFIDASNRFLSLERAGAGNLRKIHVEDFPPLPTGVLGGQ